MSQAPNYSPEVLLASLIDAHEYVSIAKIAFDDGFDLESLSKHLTNLELGIFPKFSVYHSWGAVIKGGKCTICGQPFSSCDHVEGTRSPLFG
jgi:hypothetical protein